MNKYELQLIKDNPNLSGAELARIIGVNKSAVNKTRLKPYWKHSGCGIPFLSHSIGKRGLGYKLRAKNKNVVSCSSFESAMENLDRLIYCLENNGGNLPMTTKQAVESGIRFIEEIEHGN